MQFLIIFSIGLILSSLFFPFNILFSGETIPVSAISLTSIFLISSVMIWFILFSKLNYSDKVKTKLVIYYSYATVLFYLFIVFDNGSYSLNNLENREYVLLISYQISLFILSLIYKFHSDHYHKPVGKLGRPLGAD